MARSPRPLRLRTHPVTNASSSYPAKNGKVADRPTPPTDRPTPPRTDRPALPTDRPTRPAASCGLYPGMCTKIPPLWLRAHPAANASSSYPARNRKVTDRPTPPTDRPTSRSTRDPIFYSCRRFSRFSGSFHSLSKITFLAANFAHAQKTFLSGLFHSFSKLVV